MPLQTYGNTFGPPQQIDPSNLLIGPKIKAARDANALNQQNFQLKEQMAQEARTRADAAGVRADEYLGIAKKTHEASVTKAEQERYQKRTDEIHMLLEEDNPARFLQEAPKAAHELTEEFKGKNINLGLSLLNGLIAKAAEAVKTEDPADLERWRNAVKGIKAQFAKWKPDKPEKTPKQMGEEAYEKTRQTERAKKEAGTAVGSTPEDKDKIMKRRSDIRKQMSAVKKAKATIGKVDTMTAMLQGMLQMSDSAPDELTSLPIGAKIPEELKQEAFTAWDSETDMLQEELDYLDERIGGPKKKSEKSEESTKADYTYIPGQGFVAK